MTGGFGLPSIDFSSLGQLGTTFRDARDRREAQALLGQQLDAAVSAQGQPAQAPLSALGQQAPAAPPVSIRSVPTFANLSGANPSAGKMTGNNSDFVAAMAPHAVEVAQATGVDPRIIIAQSAIETGWGKSAPGNNYFGIKSHGQAGGNTMATTENVNGQDVRTSASFRAFPSMAASVAGYGDFITKNPRYQTLRSAQGLEGQAQALQASGYATDPNYGAKVLAIAKGLPPIGGGAPAQVAQSGVPTRPQRVAYAENEGQTQALEQRMGMVPPTAQAPAVSNPQADMPAPDAIPAGFQIPGQAPQADFQPGTVASPAIGQPSAAQPAPGGSLSSAGAQRLNPAQVQNLRAMLANPQTQGYAAKIIEGLNKPDEFSFQVVGDQLVRTSKSGRAEVVPNINKPPTFSVTKGADGNDYVLNPQTGQLTRAIQGKQETYTDLTDPASRAAAGIPASYTGPAQRGPNGEIKLPGKAQTEVTVNPGEKAFKSAAGGGLAKRFQGISDEGDAGRTELALVGQLQSLADQIGTGTGAAATAKLAEYGIKVGPNVGKIEAYQSLVDKLTPSQRLPGAGATSDFDAKLFKSSLPRLINTPEGNALISNTLSALAKDKVERAAIADMALIGPDEGGISPAEAVKRLRALPAPNLVFQAGLSDLQKSGRLGAETPAPAARREVPAGTPARAALEAEARRRGLIP